MAEMTGALLAQTQRQEAAKVNLLIAVAEAVSDLLSERGDEWDDRPYRQASRIREMIEELKEAFQ